MQIQLREQAEDRLKVGSAPATRGAGTGTQALALLHVLASTPATAGDALKLLHELQVHQVELDLQQEQAEQDRCQLALDVADGSLLFERAPFAYLTLDAAGHMLAVNRMASAWLGGTADAAAEWVGQRIEDLLTPDSISALRDVLDRLVQAGDSSHGNGAGGAVLHSRAGGVSVQALAGLAPGGDRVFLALAPTLPATR